MKYKCFRKVEKKAQQGGDYWRDADFNEHLNLTYHQTTFLYLLKTYPPPKKILEAGCGIGRWVIPLSREKYDVTGIEIEQEAINVIKQYYSDSNLTLVQGDIFRMDFPNKTFDIVLSLGVLEHFEDKTILKKAIYEHMRVLKDNGMLLITVPHLSYMRLLFHMPFLWLVTLVRFIKCKKQYFSEYRYSLREFVRILERSKLKVTNIVYDDLIDPYNFGLTVDYPIKRLFASKKVQYQANRMGNVLFKILWWIHPKIVSGGIGFICMKN
jgi:2-polyprenyl-3-methyl-5-hydroxy-6-metoxy-1,4-benzoquinol methylase